MIPLGKKKKTEPNNKAKPPKLASYLTIEKLPSWHKLPIQNTALRHGVD